MLAAVDQMLGESIERVETLDTGEAEIREAGELLRAREARRRRLRVNLRP